MSGRCVCACGQACVYTSLINHVQGGQPIAMIKKQKMFSYVEQGGLVIETLVLSLEMRKKVILLTHMTTYQLLRGPASI